MKTSLFTAAALAALALTQLLTGCGPLAGVSLSFDSDGNAVISAPLRPLVIPAK
jgi:hypothetical protein